MDFPTRDALHKKPVVQQQDIPHEAAMDAVIKNMAKLVAAGPSADDPGGLEYAKLATSYIAITQGKNYQHFRSDKENTALVLAEQLKQTLNVKPYVLQIIKDFTKTYPQSEETETMLTHLVHFIDEYGKTV